MAESAEALALGARVKAHHEATTGSHDASHGGDQGGHHGGGQSSVRTAVHRGHTITIRTTYELAIDGDPLAAHMGVGEDGNVHYHGLPNYTTASAVDLMREVIDAFPEDYPPDEAEAEDPFGEAG